MIRHTMTRTRAARRFTHTLALVLTVALSLSGSVTAWAAPAETDNIYGSVSDAVSAEMLPYTRVDIIDASTGASYACVYTDGAGEFAAQIPSGAYYVKFTPESAAYAPVYYPQSPTIEGAERVTLGEWPTMTSVSLNRAASISGAMVDELNGAALTSCEVVVETIANGVWGEAARGYTDSRGHFNIGGLNPGTYAVGSVIDGVKRFPGGGSSPNVAYAVDVAAATQAQAVTVSVNSDVHAPSTSSSLATRAVRRNTVVRLKANDDKSGIEGTYYRVNGGQLIGGMSFRLTRVGFNTIEFYSVDSAGNIEPTHRQTVLVTSVR